MLVEWVAALPRWLVIGVGLGGLAAVVVAAVFALGQRFVPDTESAADQRWDGSVRRRAEIRRYLNRIDERYVERHELDGHPVAFYLPDREVAITFDPQSYFHLTDRTRADDRFVILAEHEMPGHHLGERLPFETPDVAPDPREAGDPIRAAFETLGVAPGADADRVEAAYRDRVKEVHPDQGGSREAFSELQEAYATALNHADEE
ncbi:MAG: J domain-containing protein [Halobaculum sp.]